MQEIISLFVIVPVEIEPGFEVPVGKYLGKKSLLERQSSAEPRYMLELTASQLKALAGAQPSVNVISLEFDVTRFVKLRKILVSSSLDLE